MHTVRFVMRPPLLDEEDEEPPLPLDPEPVVEEVRLAQRPEATMSGHDNPRRHCASSTFRSGRLPSPQSLGATYSQSIALSRIEGQQPFKWIAVRSHSSSSSRRPDSQRRQPSASAANKNAPRVSLLQRVRRAKAPPVSLILTSLVEPRGWREPLPISR